MDSARQEDEEVSIHKWAKSILNILNLLIIVFLVRNYTNEGTLFPAFSSLFCRVHPFLFFWKAVTKTNKK